MAGPETGRTGARFGAPARRARDTPGAEHPDDPSVPEVAQAPDTSTGPDPEIGLTGARFGGRPRRSRRERVADRKRAAQEPGPAAEEAARPGRSPDGPAAAPARPGRSPVGPAPARAGWSPDDPALDPAGAGWPPDGATHPAEPPPDEPPLIDGGRPAPIAARPYVLTGGRTKVRAELRLETMVSATGPPGAESAERRTVLTACQRPRSVSEVAALTRVPLGVARVLIDDLATEGRLRVHLGVDAASGPDLALLERVLGGLRRL